MAINILVIDDDKRIVMRLMNNLKRADESGVLGIIEVDDDVTKVDTLEKYDISHYETAFDVALIDYQLTCSFTGILVSAWIALYLKIPRLTLTTAAYPGNPDYFNGSILKNEITDSPKDVIKRIVKCVDNYNSALWLNKQHQALVFQYQELLKGENPEARPEFSAIQALLDQFEKILDEQQEEKLKKSLLYEQNTNEFIKREEKNEKKLSELNAKLNHYLEEIKND